MGTGGEPESGLSQRMVGVYLVVCKDVMNTYTKNVSWRWGRALALALVILLVVLLVGPFLVPIPPLHDTVPPEQMADAHSRFVDVDGLRVHYNQDGAGDPVMILLHGFGASVFSWREVREPLAQRGTVIAYDRPAFGLTERPLTWAPGENPYTPDAQVDVLVGLMDELNVETAFLVGHSAGGTVAAHAALTHPDRFDGLVFVAAAIYEGGGSPSWIRPLLGLPQIDRLGPLLARRIAVSGDDFLESAWHDPAQITQDIREGYRKPLRADHWDRALWELTKASRQVGLADDLDRITMPTLVVTGDDDRIVPTASSIRLARELPDAELVVIPECGHVPQEECPGPFLEAVTAFLDSVPLATGLTAGQPPVDLARTLDRLGGLGHNPLQDPLSSSMIELCETPPLIQTKCLYAKREGDSAPVGFPRSRAKEG